VTITAEVHSTWAVVNTTWMEEIARSGNARGCRPGAPMLQKP
jgi:hypothetical protein